MERFDTLILEGLEKHNIPNEKWIPPVFFGRIKASPTGLGKWLGYIDKFLLFPLICWFRIQFRTGQDRLLFILPDHSHGIYLHWLCAYTHVVHVHDLIAIRSAQNLFYGQKLGVFGRIYQNLIASGLRNGRTFICISDASRRDLQICVPQTLKATKKVVSNELNYPYQRRSARLSEAEVSGIAALKFPYFLHVGNRLWYKNRSGVLKLYEAFVQSSPHNSRTELVIVGEVGPDGVSSLHQIGKTHLFQGISSNDLELLYNNAIGLLFPSHYEGFGWPIIEAFACGCRVLTTRRSPMSEIGSIFADYLEPMPIGEDEKAMDEWVNSGVAIMTRWASDETPGESEIQKRVDYSAKFAIGSATKQYLQVYNQIQNQSTSLGI